MAPGAACIQVLACCGGVNASQGFLGAPPPQFSARFRKAAGVATFRLRAFLPAIRLRVSQVPQSPS
jgi:hypothetical protein